MTSPSPQSPPSAPSDGATVAGAETAAGVEADAGAEAGGAVGAEDAKRIRRPRDMALSLGILLVPIIVIIAIGRFLYGDTTTATVDPAVALSSAARASMSPLPQPATPDGWKVVNASYRDGVLRIGYVTAEEKGVQYAQTTAGAALIATELTPQAQRVGDVQLDGETWQRWTGRPGESALVRDDGGLTILVVGAVSEEELSELVSTVAP
ncbi:MAG: DUF4245 domain-containing protein [Hamadaea sp.]|nr:DUF4245 domain-containing protein [Hamadaea sp.]